MQRHAPSTGLIRAEHFRPFVNQNFYLEGPKGAIPVKLVEVRERDDYVGPNRNRRPFSLLFLGPPGVHTSIHLSLNLRHPKMGLIEGAFIGPIMGDVLPQWGHPNQQLWSCTFS